MSCRAPPSPRLGIVRPLLHACGSFGRVLSRAAHNKQTYLSNLSSFTHALPFSRFSHIHLIPFPPSPATQALGIDDVLSFEFVTPPSRAGIIAALEQLLSLNALDRKGQLSDDGLLMSKLPLDPSYSKALIESARTHDCAPQMLSLVAMLSTEGSAFLAPPSQRERADEAKRRFTSHHADTITLINVLSAYGNRKGSGAKAFCEQHFINRRTVDSARQARSQLVEACKRFKVLDAAKHEAAEAAEAAAVQHRVAMGLPLVDEDTGTRIRRCLTSAFFQNAAQRQPTGEYLALSSREVVAIHPSSSLFQRRASCVLFNELLYTAKLYMRDLTQIDAEWLMELAPGMYTADGAAASSSR